MISLSDYIVLTEAIKEVSGNAVVSFGRMNPPTIGHYRMMEELAKVADKHDAMALVYLSKSGPEKSPDKNPLEYDVKYELVKKYAPKGVTIVNDPNVKSLFDAVEASAKLGAKNLFLVAGADRVKEFERVKNYADKYGLDSITVIESGQRDEGISGTKMRQFALDGDYESFSKIAMPSDEKDVSSMYELVRKGLAMVKPKKPRKSVKKA